MYDECMFPERAFEVKHLTPKITTNPPHLLRPTTATEALAPPQSSAGIESVTPLRKNELMTATALAFDPAFDTALDSFDDGDGFDGFPGRRPQLRLIEGGGYDRILPAVAPLAPPASVEIYRRRRFLALVAVTALVLGIAWAAGISVTSFSGTQAAVANDAAPMVHVVLPGDSYGAIAADLGAANPVAAGEQLRIANGGGELIVGQRLVVGAAMLSAAG